MPNNHTVLTGAAGEHYVMAELLRRGLIAAKAPEGVPNMDIVVTDVDGVSLSAIQVKTRRGSLRNFGWTLGKKHEDIFSDQTFYVMVRLPDDNVAPEFFIIPSSVVAHTVKHSHQIWLRQPGARGQPHRDTMMRTLKPHYRNLVWNGLTNEEKSFLDSHDEGWLDCYENAWWQLQDELNTLEKLDEEYRRAMGMEFNLDNLDSRERQRRYAQGPCQCQTERLIERSLNKNRMRSYLFIGAFFRQAMGVRIEHDDLPTLPNIQAHSAPDEASFSWMCFANHGYDKMIDWADVSRTFDIVLDGVLNEYRFGFDIEKLKYALRNIDAYIDVGFYDGSDYGDCPERFKSLVVNKLSARLALP